MPVTGNRLGKILLIRNDRLGDLVLTLPAVEALKSALPGAELDLLCSQYNRPVAHANPHLRQVLTDRGAHDRSDLGQLAARLREERYDAAVVFVHSAKNLELVKKAEIPLRIGPWVKLTDPLRLNRPLRQRRSRAARSEAAYSIELLGALGLKAQVRKLLAGKIPPPRITPEPGAFERARELLEEALEGRPFVVVHPGMGNSALNWPERRWAETLALLAREGSRPIGLLLTGSEAERPMLARIRELAGEPAEAMLLSGLPLDEFIGVLSLARAVVAPSTGPLHLAAALGVPAVGIYSPVRAHHPRRWGPLGRNFTAALLPEGPCPAGLECNGENCPHWFCLERIEPGRVLELLRPYLAP